MEKKYAELNSNSLLFAVFCIDGIAEKLNMDGSDVYRLLTSNDNILDTYILKHYDALHTQSKEYIVEELIDLMKKEGLIQ